MRFTLKIESNNDIPLNDAEYFSADVCEDIAGKLRDGFNEGHVNDPNNGQVVGTWRLTPGETEPEQEETGGHLHCGLSGHTDPGED